MNLLILMLICCLASGFSISPVDALAVTLAKRTNNWRELVIYLCSLLPEEQGKIVIQENHQNALKFLETTFCVADGTLVTDGLYKSQVPYQCKIELIYVILESLCAVLKIHDFEIDPFAVKRRLDDKAFVPAFL